MLFCAVLLMSASLLRAVDEKSENASAESIASVRADETPFLSDSSIAWTLYKPGVRYPVTPNSFVKPLVPHSPTGINKTKLALTTGALVIFTAPAPCHFFCQIPPNGLVLMKRRHNGSVRRQAGCCICKLKFLTASLNNGVFRLVIWRPIRPALLCRYLRLARRFCKNSPSK